MRRRATVSSLLLLVAGLLLSPPIASAQSTLIKLSGYDYVTGPWQAGSTVTVVARLTPPLSGPSGFNYPFPVDFSLYEYTMAITSMVIASYSVMDWGGGLLQKDATYSGGTLRIYEDAARNSSYGSNPPNATSPSSFQDGRLVATGTLQDASSTIFTPSGSFSATVQFTNQGFSPEAWNAVIALSEPPASSVPSGYAQDFTGKIEPIGPLAAAPMSWEGVKALYRD